MERPIVIVTWHDAVQHDDGSYTAAHKPATQITIGWLIQRDDEGISFFTEYSEENQNHWRGEFFIPDGIIEQVETIEIIE